MKRVAARETVVLPPVVVEPVEVHVPPLAIEVQVRDVEKAAANAQLRPGQDDVFVPVGADIVLLGEHPFAVEQAEVRVAFTGTLTHHITRDRDGLTRIENREILDAGDIEVRDGHTVLLHDLVAILGGHGRGGKVAPRIFLSEEPR